MYAPQQLEAPQRSWHLGQLQRKARYINVEDYSEGHLLQVMSTCTVSMALLTRRDVWLH